MMRGIAQCYEGFAAIAEARFAIRHKKTRRLSAPGSLVGNTGLAAPFRLGWGNITKEPDIAMRCRFLFRNRRSLLRDSA